MSAPESGFGGDVEGIVRSAAWFLVSLAVVGVVLWAIGIEAVLGAVRSVDRRALVGLAALMGGTVLARGIALGVLFAVLGRPVARSRAVALYVASTFLNNATPSGQAGGAPASGLLIARTGDAPYEIGFAAVLLIGVCSNLVMVVFGVAGVGAVPVTAATDADLGLVAVATVGFLALLGLGLAAVVRFRESVSAASTRVAVPLARAGGRVLPRLSPPPAAAVERRVDRFWASFDRLRGASRGEALAVTALLVFAHVSNIGALWLALASLGAPVAFVVLLAVVPAATVAAVAPVPSGAGGVAVALIALLVAATEVGAPTAGAAVVLYRAVTHWFRTLVGGIVAAALLGFGRAEG